MTTGARRGELCALRWWHVDLDTGTTELIAVGVDVRTVAGRLGHSGGGVTTLRVYAAWLAEADQRAAANLLARAPFRAGWGASRSERAMTAPKMPRERLAVELREQILSGVYPEGLGPQAGPDGRGAERPARIRATAHLARRLRFPACERSPRQAAAASNWHAFKRKRLTFV